MLVRLKYIDSEYEITDISFFVWWIRRLGSRQDKIPLVQPLPWKYVFSTDWLTEADSTCSLQNLLANLKGRTLAAANRPTSGKLRWRWPRAVVTSLKSRLIAIKTSKTGQIRRWDCRPKGKQPFTAVPGKSSRRHTLPVFVPFLVQLLSLETTIPQHRLSSRRWLLVLPKKHMRSTYLSLSSKRICDFGSRLSNFWFTSSCAPTFTPQGLSFPVAYRLTQHLLYCSEVQVTEIDT